jgi:hypothetical protein
MNSSTNRKEAIRQHKERKTPVGIYAIRCTVTNTVWVDAARNLEAAKNSNWFQLGFGSHRTPSLQQEWNQHGEAAFTYEVLETLPEDAHPLAVKDLLEAKRKQWVAELNASVM